MKPEFNVLFYDFNKNKIQFVNWFGIGQWSAIKKELSKTIKKLRGFDEIQPELREFFKRELWNIEFKRCKNMDELIEYTIEKQLDRLCMYYFWAKCEYEVIVSAWPPNDRSYRKIDVYTQLKENWDIFKDIVFKELKLK
jgi:hypothetical protein